MKLSILILALTGAMPALADVPTAAAPYQRTLTREARSVWGLDAPIATMAAQIQQESAWQSDVCSSFACGLAQFTPATAQWISGAYSKELGSNQPLNPSWAIRALAQYDYDLYGPIEAATDCERWAMALSAYNGGGTWLKRDRARCDTAGCDAAVWFGQVEGYTARAPRAARENRGYPRRILLDLQAIYASWGRSVTCLPKSSLPLPPQHFS